MTRRPSSTGLDRPYATGAAFRVTDQPSQLRGSDDHPCTREAEEPTRFSRRRPVALASLTVVLMGSGLPGRAEPSSHPATTHAPADVTARALRQMAPGERPCKLSFCGVWSHAESPWGPRVWSRRAKTGGPPYTCTGEALYVGCQAWYVKEAPNLTGWCTDLNFRGPIDDRQVSDIRRETFE
jgi:hypothetical protein